MSIKYRQDEYQTLLLKILSHRLAEAYAEFIHLLVRKEYWGYAKDEELKPADILNRKYVGIRPAPGYSGCPDHRAKKKIFNLLNVQKEISISLTENYAMTPPASICGYYFANSQARYFNVGKISKDQIEDYSKRRKDPINITEKWLAHILNY